MAYDKKDMIKKSIDAIQKYQLIYIDEIFAYVPFTSKTFYNHELHKLQTIIKELELVKIHTKQYLRSEWKKSKSPFLQSQLYKLCANDDELLRLKAAEMIQQQSNDTILKKLEEIGNELNKE